MYKTLLTIMAALVLAPLASAQTVDEIIARNIQAHGGLDKLRLVQTRRESATFSSGSFKAGVLLQNKRPDKVREEFIIQSLAEVRAYDGKTGWRVSPFGGRRDPEVMSQDDTKSLEVESDMDGPLVNYKGKGHKAELMGHDSVEGTDCYKIKLTLKNGDIRTYYLDTDSFLEIKLETQTVIRGAIQESETYYGDYEEVGGIYYPLETQEGQKGQTERSTITVEKVEPNVPIDDAIFSMPAVKK
jgi:hypothetical protein